MRRDVRWAALAVVLLGCGGEETNQPVVSPPPPPVSSVGSAPVEPAVVDAAPPAAAAPVDAGPPAPPVSPVAAQFVDLSNKTATPVKIDACTEVTVSVAGGDATAMGEKLKKGDTLVLRGAGSVDLKGKGLALVATFTSSGCTASVQSLSKKVFHANAAPEIKWAAGTFKAHLDLDGEPDLYLGRLESTGPVPEHGHESSWEILAAVEASGTFTLDGQPQHLGNKGIVIVPPGVKHSWQPDAGSKLVAFQLYTPPGPEQRFKGLAAAAADAGVDGGKK